MRPTSACLLALIALAGCAPAPKPAAGPVAEAVKTRAMAACDGKSGCDPFVLCLGDAGPALVGASVGGALSATGPKGASCTGNVITTRSNAVGRVAFSCSNGQKGEGQFAVTNPSARLSEAAAVTQKGTPFHIWSGPSVWTAFADGASPAAMCVSKGLGL